MEETQKALSVRREYLQQLIDEKSQVVKKAPEGSLRMSKHRDGWQYYYRKETKDFNGTYIKERDRKFAKSLAQRDYDKKLIQVAQQEIKAIDKYFQSLPETTVEHIYQALHPARKIIVKPIRETDEEYVKTWEGVKYRGKEFVEDAPELYTLKGERVRSKSEMLIADRLYQEGIPYRYEYPLHIRGFGNIYPDFTILDVKKRKEVLWEHLGMMDDSEYVEKSLKKIEMYEKQKRIPGEGLILTYETKRMPLNSKIIDCKIKYYFK